MSNIPNTEREGERGRVIHWGESCFVEFQPEKEQEYCIQKYDTDWCFYLDHEEDALELARRLDLRAQKHPLAPGI